jgi:hypothetical protein
MSCFAAMPLRAIEKTNAMSATVMAGLGLETRTGRPPCWVARLVRRPS